MAPGRITHLAWQESVKIRRQDISSADKKGGMTRRLHHLVAVSVV
jgi:hypothetical protein